MGADGLGRDEQLLPDLGVGQALGDLLRDLELAHGQRMPWFELGTPALGQSGQLLGPTEQWPAVERGGRHLHLADERHRLRVAIRSKVGGSEVQASPHPFPPSTTVVPFVRGGVEGLTGGGQRALGQPDQSGPMLDRRRRHVGEGPDGTNDLVEPAGGGVGSAGRLVRPHAGDDELGEHAPLTALACLRQGLLATADRARRIAAHQGSLGQAPLRRQRGIEPTRTPPAFERWTEVRLGQVPIAAPEGDIAERPVGDRPRPLRSGIAQDLASLSRRVVPAAVRPRHQCLRGGQEMTTERLLDLLGVLEALGEREAGLPIVERTRRVEGGIPVGSHRGRLGTVGSSLIGDGAHGGERRVWPSFDDVDRREEHLGLLHLALQAVLRSKIACCIGVLPSLGDIPRIELDEPEEREPHGPHLRGRRPVGLGIELEQQAVQEVALVRHRLTFAARHDHEVDQRLRGEGAITRLKGQLPSTPGSVAGQIVAVEAARCIAVGHPDPCLLRIRERRWHVLDRARVELERLAMRVDPGRGGRGSERRGERLVMQAGPLEVHRGVDLHGVREGGLELGSAAVEATKVAGRHVVIERIAQQLVPEVELPLVHGVEGIEDAGLDELVERLVEVGDRPIHDPGQHVGEEAPSEHGARARDGAGVFAEPGGMGEDRVLDRVGHVGAEDLPPMGGRAADRGEQLLDVQRDAVRPCVDGIDDLPRCRQPGPEQERRDERRLIP